MGQLKYLTTTITLSPICGEGYQPPKSAKLSTKAKFYVPSVALVEWFLFISNVK